MFSGTLKVSQTARQTVLASTPSARARSTVRPPSLSNTKSLATLCAYTWPNCAFIRSQNSVSRTLPRVLPAPDQTCAVDDSVLAGWLAGRLDQGTGDWETICPMCRY